MNVAPRDGVDNPTSIGDFVRTCACGRRFRMPIPAALHAAECPAERAAQEQTAIQEWGQG